MHGLRLRWIWSKGRRYAVYMKLDPTKVEWIVRQREKGERNRVIASAMKVSKRRVQEIFAEYRRTGEVPHLMKPSRRMVQDTEEEKERVREFFSKYRENDVALERAMELEVGTHIPHNRVHRMLKAMGLAGDEPKKQARRKWVRYEREFSNSMWHADWALIPGKGWLIAYLDDASGFVVGWGLFPEATSDHSVEVLEKAIERYGRPASILTDRGIQFYAQEAGDRLRGLTAFEKYLIEHDIRHVLSRVNHPQTNGKVERFFGTVKAKMKWFSSVEELMEWYDEVKLHMSLDLHAETPHGAFIGKMLPEGMVTEDGSREVYHVDKE